MSELNYPGDTSSFPANGGPSSVYQVESQSPAQRRGRGGLAGAFAIALATALVAGGGAGYLAGSAQSGNQ